MKGPALLTYYTARGMLLGAISGPRYTFTIMKHQARHGLAEVGAFALHIRHVTPHICNTYYTYYTTYRAVGGERKLAAGWGLIYVECCKSGSAAAHLL